MEKNMIQQVMTAPGQIVFRQIPVPQTQPGQILVRIQMIGICGSDIHVYHGKHPFTSYPITQGHEVSGEIVALGEDVEGFYVGQKITIEPQVFCGKCYPCTHGKYNLCEDLKVMGFQTTGVASTYFAVDASKVTPIPQDMHYEEGAMIEPLAVAVHAVRRYGDIHGQKVVVLGAGPIGNLVAQVAKGMGAETVMVTDISDYRLELAKKCGIKQSNISRIESGRANPTIKFLQKVADSLDCDLVVEFRKREPATETCVEITKSVVATVSFGNEMNKFDRVGSTQRIDTYTISQSMTLCTI